MANAQGSPSAYSFCVGDVVAYTPAPRFFDLVVGMDQPDPDCPSLRCYRAERIEGTDLFSQTTTVVALENGVEFTTLSGFLTGIQRLPAVDVRTRCWRLKEVDELWIPEIRQDVGVWLGHSDASERFSCNRKALQANGLLPGREYEIDRWLVDEKVLTLKGATGAYYVGLFDAVLG